MNRLQKVLGTTVMAVGVAFVYCAEKSAEACGPKCSSASVVAKAKDGADCRPEVKKAIAAVLETLPVMTYRVGAFETCCSKTAAQKAAADSSQVGYMVLSQAYTDEASASAALSAALEKEFAQMQQIQFAVGKNCYGCPMAAKQIASKSSQSVKYRLAGFDFDTRGQAEQVAVRIEKALAQSGCTTASASGCAKVTTGKGCALTKAFSKVLGSGCSKSKGAVVDQAQKPDPASQAPGKLASIQDRLRVMVSTAAHAIES